MPTIAAASLGETTASATGIVLAGGRSSRFGRDKLAELYRGEPLLHHAIRRVAEVCDDVVVVLAPGALSALPGGIRVTTARDPREGEGPLSGLLAGLRAAAGDLALVVGGDMPGLVPAVLRRLLGAVGSPAASAAALQDGDRFRPLPAAVRVERALDAGDRLFAEGERSLRALLAALDVRVLAASTWIGMDPERRTLLDVDEPSDLDR